MSDDDGMRSRPRRAAATAAREAVATTAAAEAESGEGSGEGSGEESGEEEEEEAEAEAEAESEEEGEEDEEGEEPGPSSAPHLHESEAYNYHKLKHTRIYVDLDDARNARTNGGAPVLNAMEASSGAKIRTIAGKECVLVHPEWNEHCIAMNVFFHDNYEGPRFFDAYGYKYKYTPPSSRVGFYSRIPDSNCLDGIGNSCPLTEEHEKAIDVAHDLILKGKLVVARLCTCRKHKRRSCVTDTNPGSWADKFRDKLVAWSGFRIARNPGMKLVKNYKWHPDPTTRGYYTLDLVVVQHHGKLRDKLIYVIEVQHTHANTPAKRNALKMHEEENSLFKGAVQISALELLVESKAAAAQGQECVVVGDYPVSASQSFVCVPCSKARTAEEKRSAEAKRASAEELARKKAEQKAAEAAAEAAAKAERNNRIALENARVEREGRWCTSFANPVNGLFLMGVPGRPFKSSNGNRWMTLPLKPTTGAIDAEFAVRNAQFTIKTCDEHLYNHWEDWYRKYATLYVQVRKVRQDDLRRPWYLMWLNERDVLEFNLQQDELPEAKDAMVTRWASETTKRKFSMGV